MSGCVFFIRIAVVFGGLKRREEATRSSNGRKWQLSFG